MTSHILFLNYSCHTHTVSAYMRENQISVLTFSLLSKYHCLNFDIYPRRHLFRCLLVAERSNEVCLINDVTTQQHAVHCMINTETLDIRKAARLYITLVSPALITLWSLLLAEWNRMNVYMTVRVQLQEVCSVQYSSINSACGHYIERNTQVYYICFEQDLTAQSKH